MSEANLFETVKVLTQNVTDILFRTSGSWFEVEVWRQGKGRREGIVLGELTEERLVQVVKALKSCVAGDLLVVKEEDSASK